MLLSRLQFQTVCNLHSNSKTHKEHPLLASKHQQETTLPKRFPVGAKILGQNEFKLVCFHNDMCRGQQMNSPDSPGSQATPAFHPNPFATTIQYCTKNNSFQNINQQCKHSNMDMISVISPHCQSLSPFSQSFRSGFSNHWPFMAVAEFLPILGTSPARTEHFVPFDYV